MLLIVLFDSGWSPRGSFASVEIFDEENNKWPVVDHKRIPPNNLGAVEIEGTVFFVINRFPIDSGIRIPPGELYTVCLDKWEPNLRNFPEDAVLCYAPLKRETLNTDWDMQLILIDMLQLEPIRARGVPPK